VCRAWQGVQGHTHRFHDDGFTPRVWRAGCRTRRGHEHRRACVPHRAPVTITKNRHWGLGWLAAHSTCSKSADSNNAGVVCGRAMGAVVLLPDHRMHARRFSDLLRANPESAIRWLRTGAWSP
jgi:hypothetical protein